MATANFSTLYQSGTAALSARDLRALNARRRDEGLPPFPAPDLVQARMSQQRSVSTDELIWFAVHPDDRVLLALLGSIEQLVSHSPDVPLDLVHGAAVYARHEAGIAWSRPLSLLHSAVRIALRIREAMAALRKTEGRLEKSVQPIASALPITDDNALISSVAEDDEVSRVLSPSPAVWLSGRVYRSFKKRLFSPSGYGTHSFLSNVPNWHPEVSALFQDDVASGLVPEALLLEYLGVPQGRWAPSRKVNTLPAPALHSLTILALSSPHLSVRTAAFKVLGRSP